MSIGRPPQGPKLVRSLEGSPEQLRRLEAILETVSGERTIGEVCEDLGISEAQFHRLRKRALSGALEALEPRPPGRKPQEVDPREQEIAQLQAAIARLEVERDAAELREQLARLDPLPPPPPPKKTAEQRAADQQKQRAERRSRKQARKSSRAKRRGR